MDSFRGDCIVCAINHLFQKLKAVGLPVSFFVSCGAYAAPPSEMGDEVSYRNDIQPIVKNFCTTCHAGENPEGDFVLTSYEEVRKHTEKGDLLHRINDSKDPMPEDGLMPKPMRRLFQIWADTGYLNEGTRPASAKRSEYQDFKPSEITPVDVTKEGFEFLEKMQGHWVGSMKLMGTKYDWMAFDYRPISPSHVHGIFEGGTTGNLFTSFFVSRYKGKQTIMARNGGVLNGIYRTSYFVLDKVEQKWRNKTTYRFVDAYGGREIMFMELTLSIDGLEFNAYTSRLGLKAPKLHMAFKGKRKRLELAEAAARAVGFPKNQIDFSLPNPLPTPTWVGEYPMTSASYICEQEDDDDLMKLAVASKDPRRIDQMPHLSKLTVTIGRNQRIKGKKLHVYLSQKALTTKAGKFITKGKYLREDLLETLLSFPELSESSDQFTFTYLHPGSYFLTVIADMDGDGYPSPGDLSHPLIKVEVKPESLQRVVIKSLNVVN